MSVNIVKKYKSKGKNLLWFITNLGEVLNKLISKGFLAYDISTLYTTMLHNLIKEKLSELIKQTLNREGSLYLACNAVFHFKQQTYIEGLTREIILYEIY